LATILPFLIKGIQTSKVDTSNLFNYWAINLTTGSLFYQGREKTTRTFPINRDYLCKCARSILIRVLLKGIPLLIGNDTTFSIQKETIRVSVCVLSRSDEKNFAERRSASQIDIPLLIGNDTTFSTSIRPVFMVQMTLKSPAFPMLRLTRAT
jgi:hypothetical protein